MEAKITSVRNNPLLDRKNVKITLNHKGEATPSTSDIKDRVAAENDLDQDKIEIKTVKTPFGSQVSTAYAKVYQDFEYDEELEEETIEEETQDLPVAEFEEAVSGTITEAKDELEEVETESLKAALEAEKQNKDRKTLKQWIQDRL
ncbi:MAG: small subunit ribosomal protein S24e [Candidatus Nanohaloarchaea archaeon]|jgi:small subunit ribosomal protein S24e